MRNLKAVISLVTLFAATGQAMYPSGGEWNFSDDYPERNRAYEEALAKNPVPSKAKPEDLNTNEDTIVSEVSWFKRNWKMIAGVLAAVGTVSLGAYGIHKYNSDSKRKPDEPGQGGNSISDPVSWFGSSGVQQRISGIMSEVKEKLTDEHKEVIEQVEKIAKEVLDGKDIDSLSVGEIKNKFENMNTSEKDKIAEKMSFLQDIVEAAEKIGDKNIRAVAVRGIIASEEQKLKVKSVDDYIAVGLLDSFGKKIDDFLTEEEKKKEASRQDVVERTAGIVGRLLRDEAGNLNIDGLKFAEKLVDPEIYALFDKKDFDWQEFMTALKTAKSKKELKAWLLKQSDKEPETEVVVFTSGMAEKKDDMLSGGGDSLEEAEELDDENND